MTHRHLPQQRFAVKKQEQGDFKKSRGQGGFKDEEAAKYKAWKKSYGKVRLYVTQGINVLSGFGKTLKSLHKCCRPTSLPHHLQQHGRHRKFSDGRVACLSCQMQTAGRLYGSITVCHYMWCCMVQAFKKKKVPELHGAPTPTAQQQVGTSS